MPCFAEIGPILLDEGKKDFKIIQKYFLILLDKTNPKNYMNLTIYFHI
jgi:hypothetical protein